MNQLNSILLEGNLTADPSLNVTKSGTSVCHFSVASNRYFKKEGESVQDTTFVDVEAWSGLADNCNQYLTKGRGVRIIGRISQDKWVSDGVSKSKIKIVAEHIEFKPLFTKH